MRFLEPSIQTRPLAVSSKKRNYFKKDEAVSQDGGVVSYKLFGRKMLGSTRLGAECSPNATLHLSALRQNVGGAGSGRVAVSEVEPRRRSSNLSSFVDVTELTEWGLLSQMAAMIESRTFAAARHEPCSNPGRC